MIARRQAIGRILGLAGGALAATAWPRTARAEDGIEPNVLPRMYPLLVDLPGWTARRPGSMRMKKFGATMTVAARDYQRGDAFVMVQVTITQAVWTWRGMLGVKAAATIRSASSR